MNEIQEGDKVTHSFYNLGLKMTVVNINESKALCSLIDENKNPQDIWIDKTELTLVEKSDGGFT